MKKVVVFLLFIVVIGGNIIRGFPSYAEAPLSQEERLRLILEVRADSINLTKISTEIEQTMQDWLSGRKDETKMWIAFGDLYFKVLPLYEKAVNRYKSFVENYPVDMNTIESLSKLYDLLGASYSKAINIYRATMVGVQRFTEKREEKLSKGEKEALEELIVVYNRLSDVYTQFITLYAQ